MTYLKMSTKPKSWSPVQNISKFQQGIQSTHVVYVLFVFVLCTSCNKSSGITDHLTDNRNFPVKFSGNFARNVPVRLYLLLLEPLRKLTSEMTVFMLNPPSNIWEIRLINVVVFLTQPLHILSSCGKHSENCYLFSPTVQSEQMLEGMSSTCV